MTAPRLLAVAWVGSVALLGGAYLFQALGWAPCTMCLWQRWPHVVAILIGVVFVFVPSRLLIWGGALAAIITSGLGVFHSGVEQKWWDGPSTCTGGGLSNLTGAALLPGADAPALVLCDQFTPFLFGLSMANWNAMLSAVLAVIWIIAARRA